MRNFIILLFCIFGLLWFSSTKQGERLLEPVIGKNLFEDLQGTYSSVLEIFRSIGENGLDILVTDSDVESMKNGSLGSCPNKTVGQMIEGYMSTPRWSSGTAEGGQKFVNVTGGIMYVEKEVTAQLQFLVTGDSFELGAVMFNEVPQFNLWGESLLEKMCEKQ